MGEGEIDKEREVRREESSGGKMVEREKVERRETKRRERGEGERRRESRGEYSVKGRRGNT